MENYILDMYLNEELSNEDILDLYEYGYISEDVLEYIEEGLFMRGIRHTATAIANTPSHIEDQVLKQRLKDILKKMDENKRKRIARNYITAKKNLKDAKDSGNGLFSQYSAVSNEMNIRKYRDQMGDHKDAHRKLNDLHFNNK